MLVLRVLRRLLVLCGVSFRLFDIKGLQGNTLSLPSAGEGIHHLLSLLLIFIVRILGGIFPHILSDGHPVDKDHIHSGKEAPPFLSTGASASAILSASSSRKKKFCSGVHLVSISCV